MKNHVLSFWACVALLGISPANALTYDLVNDSSGNYEVTGFIETDGNFGVLTNGDLINWDSMERRNFQYGYEWTARKYQRRSNFGK